MLKILFEDINLPIFKGKMCFDGISKLIHRCDDNLFSYYNSKDCSLDKCREFNTLLYEYVTKHQDLLIEYVDKMFLYFCKNMNIKVFNEHMTQHVHLFSELSIDDGLNACAANVNGDKIIEWFIEKNIILSNKRKIEIHRHAMDNNNDNMLVYLNKLHAVTIMDYYKTLDDNKLKRMLSYQENFHIILEYFDANRILNLIGFIASTCVGKNKCHNKLMIPFLYDNLDFNKIDENNHIYVIFYFLPDDRFLRKYLTYRTDMDKQINMINGLLSLDKGLKIQHLVNM